MNRSLLQTVLRRTGELTGAPATEADAELLRRFARDRDEPAFAELLRRHGPMVWAVCRHMLPDPADAEDAFQATFLALVRSAAAVRRGAAVGGWLHGVAVRVATKARRSAARRRQREHRAAGPEADRSVPEATWDALLAAVHEEVQQLPDPLRAAFVLCDLEGVRQPDAAARLGWKPGTLTGRLARARQLLMDRLTSRGLAPAVAGGTVGLGVATAAGAVPAGLVDKALTLVAAGGPVPPAVQILVREVTPMVLNRTKLAAAVLLAGGLTAGVGAALFPVAQAQPGPPGGGGGGPAGNFRPGTSPAPPGRPAVPKPPQPPQPGQPPTPEGGHGWTGVFAGTSARTQWEYQFADLPRTQKEFASLLAARGGDGWEFAGVVDFPRDPATTGTAVVFKRAKSGAAGVGIFRGPGGGGGAGAGGLPPFPGAPGLPSAPGGALPGASGQRGGGASGTSQRASGAAAGMGPPGMMAGSGMAGMMGSMAMSHPVDRPLTVIKLKHARAAELTEVLKKVFTQRLEVTPDERTNSLILRADQAELAELKQLIERLDIEDSDPAPAPKR